MVGSVAEGNLLRETSWNCSDLTKFDKALLLVVKGKVTTNINY